jgi:hypothetical protein
MCLPSFHLRVGTGPVSETRSLEYQMVDKVQKLSDPECLTYDLLRLGFGFVLHISFWHGGQILKLFWLLVKMVIAHLMNSKLSICLQLCYMQWNAHLIFFSLRFHIIQFSVSAVPSQYVERL